MRIRPLRRSVLKAFVNPSFLALLFLPPPAMPQAAPEQAVIQGGTHVVLVNVVAKDKHGKLLDDLGRDDFVLRDNGQEQKITLFALEKTGDTRPAAVANSPAGMTFTNRSGPNNPAVTAFLFDELNTQLTDQELAKKDFLRYLRGLPADSRAAVFALGDSLALLHDFSQDMASLLTALTKHSSRVNPEVTASTAPPASANSISGDQTTSALWDTFLQSGSQPYINYTQTVRATRTAAALQTIAGHLQGIPGRKTLIWISGGFPIQLGLHNSVDSRPQSNPNARQSGRSSARGGGGQSGASIQTAASNAAAAANPSSTDLPGAGQSFESDVARAIRALNEADVAVFPVDARGITTPAAMQADRSSIGKRGSLPKAGAGTDYNYDTLQTLAQETGGRAFHHINDLNTAIQEAASDGRVSYSLAFSPPADSLDGSYHRLEVAVRRPDVNLRYRPGYVAAPDAALAPSLAEAIANPVPLAGIGFTVHLEPVDGGYRASLTIDPRSITLEPKDGKWVGSLQFLVLVGKVEQLTTIPLTFTEDKFREIQEKGLQMSTRVKTRPDTTGFSIGFRDVPSGLVGTLHVPL